MMIDEIANEERKTKEIGTMEKRNELKLGDRVIVWDPDALAPGKQIEVIVEELMEDDCFGYHIGDRSKWEHIDQIIRKIS